MGARVLTVVGILLFCQCGLALDEPLQHDPNAVNHGGVAGPNEYRAAIRLEAGCSGSVVGNRMIATAAHCVVRREPSGNLEYPWTFFSDISEEFKTGSAITIYRSSDGWSQGIALTFTVKKIWLDPISVYECKQGCINTIPDVAFVEVNEDIPGEQYHVYVAPEEKINNNPFYMERLLKNHHRAAIWHVGYGCDRATQDNGSFGTKKAVGYDVPANEENYIRMVSPLLGGLALHHPDFGGTGCPGDSGGPLLWQPNGQHDDETPLPPRVQLAVASAANTDITNFMAFEVKRDWWHPGWTTDSVLKEAISSGGVNVTNRLTAVPPHICHDSLPNYRAYQRAMVWKSGYVPAVQSYDHTGILSENFDRASYRILPATGTDAKKWWMWFNVEDGQSRDPAYVNVFDPLFVFDISLAEHQLSTCHLTCNSDAEYGCRGLSADYGLFVQTWCEDDVPQLTLTIHHNNDQRAYRNGSNPLCDMYRLQASLSAVE